MCCSMYVYVCVVFHNYNYSKLILPISTNLHAMHLHVKTLIFDVELNIILPVSYNFLLNITYI